MSIGYVTLVMLKVAIAGPQNAAIVIAFDDTNVGHPYGPLINIKEGISNTFCVEKYLRKL